MYFDFLIPRRPVSSQTKSRNNLQAWKRYVQGEAAKTWSELTYSEQDIELTLVYLYDRDPVDIDNIVKPIQDALEGLVYTDDVLITDVKSHRRSLAGIFDVARCPGPLIQGIASGEECVYVRVSTSRALEDYL
jgi:hypothetical protein